MLRYSPLHLAVCILLCFQVQTFSDIFAAFRHMKTQCPVCCGSHSMYSYSPTALYRIRTLLQYVLRVVHKVLHRFLPVTLATQQIATRLGFQMQQDGGWIVPSARDPEPLNPKPLNPKLNHAPTQQNLRRLRRFRVQVVERCSRIKSKTLTP